MVLYQLRSQVKQLIESILSTQRFTEYQGFVENVGENRFNKVTQRQLNKFNTLLNKEEGNITGVSTQFSSSQGSNSLRDSATSQAVGVLPWEGLVASQAGMQAGTHLPSQEGSSLAASQAGSQAAPYSPGDSASFQADSTVNPNNTPAREGPSQADRNSPLS